MPLAFLPELLPVALFVPAIYSILQKIVWAYLLDRRRADRVEVQFSDAERRLLVRLDDRADVEHLATVLAELSDVERERVMTVLRESAAQAEGAERSPEGGDDAGA